MARSPRRPNLEAWRVFGRWRRPPPAHRRLGIALLVLALILTLLWARAPRAPPAAAPGVPEPAVAVVNAGAFTTSGRHSA